MRIPVTDPSMRQFVLKLPWTEFTNKAKTRKKSINLNLYRNLHFQELSNQKNHFHTRMVTTLEEIPPLGCVWLHYEIHPSHRGRLDTMNVTSIVDKYFSDSLTELGIIEDDDYTHVVFNSFCFGSVVRGEAYVSVTITELEPRKTRMRVFLDNHEIQTALAAFIAESGLNGATGCKLTVQDDGEITAEVLFGVQNDPRETSAVTDEDEGSKPKSRGGRPAGSKNKPKEEVTDNVGTSGEGSSGRDAEGAGQESGGASGSDEDDFLKPKGGNTKNPSEDSPGESSKGSENDSGKDAETVSTEGQEVKAKRPSIFDDE